MSRGEVSISKTTRKLIRLIPLTGVIGLFSSFQVREETKQIIIYIIYLGIEELVCFSGPCLIKQYNGTDKRRFDSRYIGEDTTYKHNPIVDSWISCLSTNAIYPWNYKNPIRSQFHRLLHSKPTQVELHVSQKRL